MYESRPKRLWRYVRERARARACDRERQTERDSAEETVVVRVRAVGIGVGVCMSGLRALVVVNRRPPPYRRATPKNHCGALWCMAMCIFGCGCRCGCGCVCVLVCVYGWILLYKYIPRRIRMPEESTCYIRVWILPNKYIACRI